MSLKRVFLSFSFVLIFSHLSACVTGVCHQECVCGHTSHQTTRTTFTKSKPISEAPEYSKKSYTNADLNFGHQVTYDYNSIQTDILVDRACYGCCTFCCAVGIPFTPFIPCAFPVCNQSSHDFNGRNLLVKERLLKITPFFTDPSKALIELETFSIPTEKPTCAREHAHYATQQPGFSLIVTKEESEGTTKEGIKFVAKRADNAEAYKNYEIAMQESLTQTDLNKKEAFESREEYTKYEPKNFSHFDGQELVFTLTGNKVIISLENLKVTKTFSASYDFMVLANHPANLN